MFDDYTKEHPSSWEDSDVKKWKEKAKETLKSYYTAFGGRQWDEYDMPKDRDLLRAKICYAMFGPPTKAVKRIEDAYNAKHRESADKIIKQITEECGKLPKGTLKVGIIFICCKQEEKEYELPLFSVHGGANTANSKSSCRDIRYYVDTMCRTYKSWDDWKENNKLPMLKYAYPKMGYFTCSGRGAYEFDTRKDPVVEFGTSPQCDISSRIFRQTDAVSAITSLGSGILCAASLFTPIGPAVVLGSAIAGGCSALYGTGRAVHRLVDKGQHGESLADLESWTLWVSIAATPLNFASTIVNANLVRGATANGRIFSSSTRMFATILNFTTLGVDGIMLGFGFANLIDKYEKEQLTALDVVQFSMSIFFFTNTLIQPKVASKIIEKAQDQHVQAYKNTMTDAEAQASFQRFLDQNIGQGTITDKSKIVRAINRIEDPNGFFKGMTDARNMEIGGRKGKTILVTDAHGNTNRLNPNRILLTKNVQGSVNFKRDYKRLEKCFGKTPEDVELNGQKIFKGMTDRQKGRVGKAFGGSARYDKDMVQTAFEVAESMGLKTADDLMSVIEIVAAHVEGKDGRDLTSALQHIQGAGKHGFIESIQNDVGTAIGIGKRTGLEFSDPLTAVYHYRKHGPDFPSKITGNTIDFYLGEVPQQLIRDAQLREIQTLQDGTVRKTYIKPNNHFAVVTETPDNRKISTMFRRPGSYEDFQKCLEKIHKAAGQFNVESPKVMADQVAHAMGFRAMHVYLTVNGKRTPLDGCTDLDFDIQAEMARLLGSLIDGNGNNSDNGQD